jgi:hypothetical protein
MFARIQAKYTAAKKIMNEIQEKFNKFGDMADNVREQMIMNFIKGAARTMLVSRFSEEEVAKAETVCNDILGDKDAQGVIAPETRITLVGTFGEKAVSIGELLADAIVNGLDVQKITDAVINHLKSVMRKHLVAKFGEEKVAEFEKIGKALVESYEFASTAYDTIKGFEEKSVEEKVLAGADVLHAVMNLSFLKEQLEKKFGKEKVNKANLVATAILGDSNTLARNETGELLQDAHRAYLVKIFGEEPVVLGETIYKAVTGDQEAMEELLEVAKVEARKILVAEWGEQKIRFCEDFVKALDGDESIIARLATMTTSSLNGYVASLPDNDDDDNNGAATSLLLDISSNAWLKANSEIVRQRQLAQRAAAAPASAAATRDVDSTKENCKCDTQADYEKELAKDDGKCVNAPQMKVNLRLSISTNDYRCVLHCASKRSFTRAKQFKLSTEVIPFGKIGAECSGIDREQKLLVSQRKAKQSTKQSLLIQLPQTKNKATKANNKRKKAAAKTPTKGGRNAATKSAGNKPNICCCAKTKTLVGSAQKTNNQWCADNFCVNSAAAAEKKIKHVCEDILQVCNCPTKSDYEQVLRFGGEHGQHKFMCAKVPAFEKLSRGCKRACSHSRGATWKTSMVKFPDKRCAGGPDYSFGDAMGKCVHQTVETAFLTVETEFFEEPALIQQSSLLIQQPNAKKATTRSPAAKSTSTAAAAATAAAATQKATKARIAAAKARIAAAKARIAAAKAAKAAAAAAAKFLQESTCVAADYSWKEGVLHPPVCDCPSTAYYEENFKKNGPQALCSETLSFQNLTVSCQKYCAVHPNFQKTLYKESVRSCGTYNNTNDPAAKCTSMNIGTTSAVSTNSASLFSVGTACIPTGSALTLIPKSSGNCCCKETKKIAKGTQATSFRYCRNACNDHSAAASLLETDKMKKEQLMKKLECPNKARLQQALADRKTCASQMIDITEESCRVGCATAKEWSSAKYKGKRCENYCKCPSQPEYEYHLASAGVCTAGNFDELSKECQEYCSTTAINSIKKNWEKARFQPLDLVCEKDIKISGEIDTHSWLKPPIIVAVPVDECACPSIDELEGSLGLGASPNFTCANVPSFQILSNDCKVACSGPSANWTNATLSVAAGDMYDPNCGECPSMEEYVTALNASEGCETVEKFTNGSVHCQHECTKTYAFRTASVDSNFSQATCNQSLELPPEVRSCEKFEFPDPDIDDDANSISQREWGQENCVNRGFKLKEIAAEALKIPMAIGGIFSAISNFDIKKCFSAALGSEGRREIMTGVNKILRENFGHVVDQGYYAIQSVIDKFWEGIDTIVQHLKDLREMIVKMPNRVVEMLRSEQPFVALKDYFNELPGLAQEKVMAIVSTAQEQVKSIIQVFSSLKDSVLGNIDGMKDRSVVTDILRAVVKTATTMCTAVPENALALANIRKATNVLIPVYRELPALWNHTKDVAGATFGAVEAITSMIMSMIKVRPFQNVTIERFLNSYDATGISLLNLAEALDASAQSLAVISPEMGVTASCLSWRLEFQVVQVMDNMKEFGLCVVRTAPNAFKNIWETFMDSSLQFSESTIRELHFDDQDIEDLQCLTSTFNPLGQLIPGLYAPGEDSLPETTDDNGTTVAVDSQKQMYLDIWNANNVQQTTAQTVFTSLSTLLSLVPHIPEVFESGVNLMVNGFWVSRDVKAVWKCIFQGKCTQGNKVPSMLRTDRNMTLEEEDHNNTTDSNMTLDVEEEEEGGADEAEMVALELGIKRVLSPASKGRAAAAVKPKSNSRSGKTTSKSTHVKQDGTVEKLETTIVGKIISAIDMAKNAVPQITYLLNAITDFKNDFKDTYAVLESSSWNLPAALEKFHTISQAVLEKVEDILRLIISLAKDVGGSIKNGIDNFMKMIEGKLDGPPHDQFMNVDCTDDRTLVNEKYGREVIFEKQQVILTFNFFIPLPLTFGIPIRVTVTISIFGRAQVEQGACRRDSDLSNALTPYDDTYHVVPAISFGIDVMISVAIDLFIVVIGIKMELNVVTFTLPLPMSVNPTRSAVAIAIRPKITTLSGKITIYGAFGFGPFKFTIYSPVPKPWKGLSFALPSMCSEWHADNEGCDNLICTDKPGTVRACSLDPHKVPLPPIEPWVPTTPPGVNPVVRPEETGRCYPCFSNQKKGQIEGDIDEEFKCPMYVQRQTATAPAPLHLVNGRALTRSLDSLLAGSFLAPTINNPLGQLATREFLDRLEDDPHYRSHDDTTKQNIRERMQLFVRPQAWMLDEVAICDERVERISRYTEEEATELCNLADEMTPINEQCNVCNQNGGKHNPVTKSCEHFCNSETCLTNEDNGWDNENSIDCRESELHRKCREATEAGAVRMKYFAVVALRWAYKWWDSSSMEISTAEGSGDWTDGERGFKWSAYGWINKPEERPQMVFLVTGSEKLDKLEIVRVLRSTSPVNSISNFEDTEYWHHYSRDGPRSVNQWFKDSDVNTAGRMVPTVDSEGRLSASHPPYATFKGVMNEPKDKLQLSASGYNEITRTVESTGMNAGDSLFRASILRPHSSVHLVQPEKTDDNVLLWKWKSNDTDHDSQIFGTMSSDEFEDHSSINPIVFEDIHGVVTTVHAQCVECMRSGSRIENGRVVDANELHGTEMPASGSAPFICASTESRKKFKEEVLKAYKNVHALNQKWTESMEQHFNNIVLEGGAAEIARAHMTSLIKPDNQYGTMRMFVCGESVTDSVYQGVVVLRTAADLQMNVLGKKFSLNDNGNLDGKRLAATFEVKLANFGMRQQMYNTLHSVAVCGSDRCDSYTSIFDDHPPKETTHESQLKKLTCPLGADGADATLYQQIYGTSSDGDWSVDATAAQPASFLEVEGAKSPTTRRLLLTDFPDLNLDIGSVGNRIICILNCKKAGAYAPNFDDTYKGCYANDNTRFLWDAQDVEISPTDSSTFSVVIGPSSTNSKTVTSSQRRTMSCPSEVDRNNWLTTPPGPVCEDDTSWTSPQGNNCDKYVSNGWCAGGGESPDHLDTRIVTGNNDNFNASGGFPEDHCCECGSTRMRIANDTAVKLSRSAYDITVKGNQITATRSDADIGWDSLDLAFTCALGASNSSSNFLKTVLAMEVESWSFVERHEGLSSTCAPTLKLDQGASPTTGNPNRGSEEINSAPGDMDKIKMFGEPMNIPARLQTSGMCIPCRDRQNYGTSVRYTGMAKQGTDPYPKSLGIHDRGSQMMFPGSDGPSKDWPRLGTPTKNLHIECDEYADVDPEPKLKEQDQWVYEQKKVYCPVDKVIAKRPLFDSPTYNWTVTNDATKCLGDVCDVEGQFCPDGVPGASGQNYTCKSKQWVKVDLKPPSVPLRSNSELTIQPQEECRELGCQSYIISNDYAMDIKGVATHEPVRNVLPAFFFYIYLNPFEPTIDT